jgi:polysaccharide export outer membrane protein
MRAARIFLPLLAALLAAAYAHAQQYNRSQYPQTGYSQQSYAAPQAYAQPSTQDTGNRGLFTNRNSFGHSQRAYAQPTGRQAYARQAYSQQNYGRDGYVQQYYGPRGSVMQYRPPRAAAAPSAMRAYAAAPYSYAAAPYSYAYAPASQSYTLDSGDKLRVVVFGQQGITGSYMVDAGGNVSLPLVGSVPARGVTTQQLARMIVERLKQGYVREPHVTVEIETYRPFFILGEVTNPGQYPYVANMTAENAIAIAGGFAPRADKNKIQLTRTADGRHYKGDVPLSYPLRPGDTLVVKERWF